MLKKINNTFLRLIDHELQTAKVLFAFLSVGFAVLTVSVENIPAKGAISYQMLVGFDAFMAFVICILLFFFKPAQQRFQLCAYVFMYALNTVNLYLLWATSFDVKTGYQFVIAYTIMGWFFRSKNSWLVFTVVSNILLLVVSAIADHPAGGSLDIYTIYIIASFAQLVLIHFRFTVEEKLTESERKYRLLAENSFDLICIHDVKGRLEFVSPSSKRLLGYSPEELIGGWPWHLVHPDDAKLIKAIRLGDPMHPFLSQPIQFRLMNKKGEYVWLETIFTLLDSADGETNVALSQSRDIRRSKKFQQELIERTHELERSNADLETFAFVSSHDMQEPLRMISNYMQLLKKKYSGTIDAEAEEYIDFANKGASNLQQLLRDLLSYSRITRAEIRKGPVNTNTLVNEILKNIELQLKEKNAKVFSETLPQVTADKNLLMLVIQNLILNGVKYNKNENPQVSVRHFDSPNEHIFCIEDNGIGISKEHQQRIFEPFHRLHTKAEFPGTGLGLSICKKVLERMGGEVWVESETGKGSKFFFSLPKH